MESGVMQVQELHAVLEIALPTLTSPATGKDNLRHLLVKPARFQQLKELGWKQKIHLWLKVEKTAMVRSKI